MQSQDLEHVIADPGKFFKQPSEILESQKYSRNEKLTLLKAWRENAKLRATADDEGMTKSKGQENNLLVAIAEAIDSLEN